MKKLFAFLLSFYCIPICHAQEELRPAQLSFAYYGNVINEQGGRIGAHFYLKHWEQVKNDESMRNWDFYVEPNLGFVSRPLFYSNFQLAVDAGIRRQGEHHRFYHALAIGAGYLARMEVVSFTVDFKGEVVSKSRETWDYLLPTISYELGKDITEGIGWFLKFNYGMRFPFQSSQEQGGMPLFEVGMKLPLKRSKNNG